MEVKSAGKIQFQEGAQRPCHSTAGTGNSGEPADRTSDSCNIHKKDINQQNQQKCSCLFQL